MPMVRGLVSISVAGIKNMQRKLGESILQGKNIRVNSMDQCEFIKESKRFTMCKIKDDKWNTFPSITDFFGVDICVSFSE